MKVERMKLQPISRHAILHSFFNEHGLSRVDLSIGDRQRSVPSTRQFLIPILLAVLSLLAHLWLAPLTNRISPGYINETEYAAQARFRETPQAAWQEFPLLARRLDQVLLVFDDVAIIQGESHWTTEDGTPTYEPIGLYGVHRLSRMNVGGYGDHDRSGQFLFPYHLEKKTYSFWDPYYLGPRTAVFDHVDRVEGLTVYVFRYAGTGIDDTAGYTVLPDVPERYQAISQAEGTLWIEPVSGIVVDLQDQGVTNFVDVRTGEYVADFYHWTARYTDETRSEQLALARTDRLRILTLETWLPLVLVLLAATWLIRAWHRPWPRLENSTP